jgi:hypothetical protein
MKHNLACSLILCCLFVVAGSQSFAEDLSATKPTTVSSDKQGSYYLCKLNNIVRTVRVNADQDGACEATYTKEGVDKVVGKSTTAERCYKVISNIKENLEKAAWKCKDISQARVSSSTEN